MKIYSKVKIPVALASAGGVFQDFVWNQMIRGHKINFGEQVEILGINPNIQPSFSDLATIVQNGGYFEGIKLGLEFANASAAQQLVPEGIRGAIYVDEEGQAQNRSWVEWLRESQNEILRHTSGSPYITKAKFGTLLLNSDELALAHAEAGVSVIEWADVMARLDSEEYEVFTI